MGRVVLFLYKAILKYKCGLEQDVFKGTCKAVLFLTYYFGNSTNNRKYAALI
jgi:hypothetical protein